MHTLILNMLSKGCNIKTQGVREVVTEHLRREESRLLIETEWLLCNLKKQKVISICLQNLPPEKAHVCLFPQMQCFASPKSEQPRCLSFLTPALEKCS